MGGKNATLIEPQKEGEEGCLFICPHIQPEGDGCQLWHKQISHQTQSRNL